MTSSAAKPASRIASFDPPDPDNFLLPIRVINRMTREFPNETTALVMSPRPVSFKAAPYGKAFHQLYAAIDEASTHEQDCASSSTILRRLISTVTERTLHGSSWLDRLKPKDRAWFYPDLDCSDPTVEEDTRLYLRVTVCRVFTILDAQNINRKRWDLYWDEKSLGKISVGMRHAYHVPDFTWGFDGEQRARYDALIASNIDADGNVRNVLSDDLRNGITEICNDYVQKTTLRLGLDPDCLLGNLDDLVVSNLNADIVPEIYVGGPPTEALAYCKRAPVKRIIGMGGFIHGLSNLFPNQFNFHVSMGSAKELLELASSGQVSLTLLPTECVKNSVYALSYKEVKECFSESPALWELFLQYYRDADPMSRTTYPLFDWVLALTIEFPGLFTSKAVKMDTKKDSDGTEVIVFHPDEEGKIIMYWNDPEYMMSYRSRYIDALKDTFKKPAVLEGGGSASS